MSNTNLTYHGKVSFEVKNHGYVKHNHGTVNLFRLFSVIMSREFFNVKNLPTYMMLYDEDTSTLIESPFASPHMRKSLLHSFLDIQSYSAQEEEEHQVVFTTLITTAHLLNIGSTKYNRLSLALVAGDRETILAVVDFDVRLYRVVESGDQVLVKWIMGINNAE